MLVLALLVGASRPATAQEAQADEASSVGTLIVAHGAGPEWNAQVETVAREVHLPGPVAVSFLMGPGAATHRFQDVVHDLVERGARRIVVVPLLVSSHSGHYDQIRYLTGGLDSLDAEMLHHLRMSGITRPTAGVPLQLVGALDDAPEMAVVLAAHARTLARAPQDQALFLIGHGPNSGEDYAAWMTNLRRVADTVRARTGFRSVLVGLVQDDAPPPVRAEAVARIRELIQLQHAVTGREVVVVPILIANGTVSNAKVPHDLEGLPVAYTAAGLAPDTSIARWIEARVQGAGVPR